MWCFSWWKYILLFQPFYFHFSFLLADGPMEKFQSIGDSVIDTGNNNNLKSFPFWHWINEEIFYWKLNRKFNLIALLCIKHSRKWLNINQMTQNLKWINRKIGIKSASVTLQAKIGSEETFHKLTKELWGKYPICSFCGVIAIPKYMIRNINTSDWSKFIT